MKILLAFPGHLKTVPMGRFSAEALRELGHEVVPFDYHSSPFEKLFDRFSRAPEERPSVNRRFRRVVDRERPELFVAVYGADISPDSLDYLRARGIPKACWWINDPFQFERSAKKARFYDFMFSNSAGSAAEYRKLGIAHSYFLPTACVPAIHRPVPPEDRYRTDVCFAGDWSPLREQVMQSLIGEFDVKIFGPWQKKLKPDSPLLPYLSNGFFTPDQMVAMFASAQIVINLHTWYGKFEHGLNPRLFEAAACAAFQVVDWKQEIPEVFDVPGEMVCYRHLEEMPDLIRASLADRERIRRTALAAQKRAYRDHTYRNRMATLLDTVGKAGS